MSATTTPQETLEERRTRLEQQETELRQSTLLNKASKEDLVVAERLRADFERMLDAYQKSLQKNQNDTDAMANYSENKRPMIEVAVNAKLTEIDEIIKEFNDEVDTCRGELENIGIARGAAKIVFEQANGTLTEKNRLLDEVKLHQKQLEDNLKKLAGLQTAIEKAEEENKFAVMHYMMEKEFIPVQALVQSTFQEPGQSTLITKDKLEQKLNDAGNAMDLALQAFRQKEAEKNSTEESYNKKQAELKTLKDGLRAKILGELAEIDF